MYGVYLHILSDTGGSVAVIISTLLIQNYGWLWVDPLCSLLLAMLIIVGVLPLVKESATVLLQSNPDEHDFVNACEEILRIDGVLSYSGAHCWQLKSDYTVASVHVQITAETHAQPIIQRVTNIVSKYTGATQITVQVETEAFFQRIHSLYPSYEAPARHHRPMQQSVMAKAI